MSDTPDRDLFFTDIVAPYIANRRFLRRDWLTQELAERLKGEKSRFLLLTAEPGVGKSTFMAQLAHDRPDWPRYFIRRDQRTPLADVSAQSFLLRIGFQLAALYPQLFSDKQIRLSIEQRVGDVAGRGEVVGAEVKRIVASPFYQSIVKIEQHVTRNQGKVVGLRLEELVIEPRMVETDKLMYMALIDPAEALQRLEPRRQIVVLVDALDEIRYHQVANNILEWLTGCPELPGNIRFVLTSRPPDQALRIFREKQDRSLISLAISETDPHVERDVEQFVKGLVGDPALLGALKTEAETRAFADRATRKAHGNLGYLDALARGIDRALASGDPQALQALLSLEELPAELEGLYAFFLSQIKNAVSRQLVEIENPEGGDVQYLPAWPAVFRPILGVLAVAQEPLVLKQLYAFGRIKAEWGYFIDAVDRLSQFMDRPDERCRLYHATVAEFLTDLRTRERHDVADLYIDPIKWHGQIANHYWQTFNPNWERLDDAYGLGNLAYHLKLGGANERLQTLISDRWMRARYAGSRNGYAGFMSDVELAWQAAMPAASSNPEPLVRLRTIRGVVGRQVNTYTDIDLEILVRLGRADEALQYARLRTGSSAVSGLVVIAETMAAAGEKPDTTLLNEAQGIATSGADERERSTGLAQLVKAFAAIGNFETAVLLARAIPLEWPRAHALCEFVSVLVDAGQPDKAAAVARAIELSTEHDMALRIVERARERKDPAPEAEAQVSKAAPRARLFSALSVALQRYHSAVPRQVARSCEEASGETSILETVAWRVCNDSETAAVLGMLVRVGASLATEGLHDEPEDSAESGKRTAPVIVPIEPATTEHTAVDEGTPGAIPDAGERVQALLAVATTLVPADGARADDIFDEAAAVIPLLSDAFWQRSQALADLASALGETGRYQKAFEVAFSITDPLERDRTLRSLVIMLGRAGRYEDALRLAEKIGNAWLHLISLEAVAKLSTTATSFEVAAEAVQLMADGDERRGVLEALVRGLYEAGREADAIGFAGAPRPDRDRARLLGAIAELQIKRGRLVEAEATACSIPVIFGYSARENSLSLLAKTLGAQQRFDEGVRIARLILGHYLRSAALDDLVKALGRAGRFDEAIDLANSIEDDSQRLNTRAGIVNALISAGRLEQATALARALEDTYQRSEALKNVATAFMRARSFEEADAVVKLIPDDHPRRAALVNQVAAIADASEFETAERLMDRIDHKWGRFCALSSIVVARMKTGEHAAAARTMQKIVSGDVWPGVLAEVRSTLARQRERESGAELEARPQDSAEQVDAWQLAETLSVAGCFDEAREVAGSIPNDWERIQALRKVAAAAARAGHELAVAIFEQVLKTVGAGINTEECLAALRAVAVALARAAHPAATTVFEGVRLASEELTDDSRKTEELTNLAGALADAGRFDDARTLAKIIPSSSRQQYALRSIAAGLERAGHLKEARELVRDMRKAAGTDGAHRSIVNALAEVGYVDEARKLARASREIGGREYVANELPSLLAARGLFGEAWEELEAIRTNRARGQALSALGAALARAGNDRAKNAFDEAEHVARFLMRRRDRDQGLNWVATALGEAGWFEKAMDVAGSIEKDRERTEAMTRLAELRAATLAAERQFSDALIVLGDGTLDSLVRAIAGWAPAFEKVQRGLSVKALGEVTGVAGWVRADWNRIYGLLKT